MLEDVEFSFTEEHYFVLPEGFVKGTKKYCCTFKYQGRTMATPYYMGPGLKHEPSMQEVLYCLFLDADCVEYVSFEGWSRDMGYDTDSVKAMNSARRIYQACERTAKDLVRLFGDDLEDIKLAIYEVENP